ncbi:MAG: CDP-alcohol phosphatidyltransferase [Ferruginibacter sp.]|nr:CDP-alcohol phosphatidyltransferase [Ferruginibacter sp.]
MEIGENNSMNKATDKNGGGLRYYLINGITLYRLIASLVLILLIFLGQSDIFKWLLAQSFFTDAVDGYLARRLKVTSLFGARLDSVADDLTIVAAMAGVVFFKMVFVREQKAIFILLLVLFLVQNVLAFSRYGKMSSFHTYLAKLSAVLQGVFFILLFFLQQPVYWLFYTAALFTAADLAEEIILILLLPQWKANVKGLYWLLKNRRTA